MGSLQSLLLCKPGSLEVAVFPGLKGEACQLQIDFAYTETISFGTSQQPTKTHLVPRTGDTDSPLVRGRGADQPPELLGLMAFGTGCGTPGDYSVSVAVQPYLAWIRETIKR